MRGSRLGLSRVIISGMVIGVILVAAAGLVVAGGMRTSTSSNSTLSSSSSQASPASSTASTGTLIMTVVQPVILSPGMNQTFTLTFNAIGNLSGTFLLSATGVPTSVGVTFAPSAVTFPDQLTSLVYFTMAASKSATPADVTFTIQAESGSTALKSSQSLRIVQYLVTIQGDSYDPAGLTIKAGSTVLWVNWDILGGRTQVEPADLVSNGMHSVVADDGSFSSPTLSLNAPVYSHTFLTAGQFSYHDGLAPSMVHGAITVTSG